MNYEQIYWSIVPGYTKYLAAQPARYYVAAGSSASALARDVKASASQIGIELQPIYSLSRDESHAMYIDHNSDPVLILRHILSLEQAEEGLSAHTVNIIEDYTLNGEKSLHMDRKLAESPYNRGYYFFYHVLVSGLLIMRSNVYTHLVDLDLAEYRDVRFNGTMFQFDERP